MGPRAGMDIVKKRKIFLHLQRVEAGCPARTPLLYRLGNFGYVRKRKKKTLGEEINVKLNQ
jgi:hypothetical protein